MAVQNVSRCAAALCVLCGASAAGAQTTFEWFGGGDGQSYGDPQNWSPSGVPTGSDEAKFDLGGVSDVSFALNRAVSIASIENEAVTFRLQGRTFTAEELIVGERLSDVGELILRGGSLVTTTGLAQIGRLSPSTGTLIVTNGASMTNQRDLIVGDEGQGSFRIDPGGAGTSAITFIGDEPGSSGDAVIRGRWDILGAALVGNAGSGSLTVDNGGEVLIGLETKLGDEPGAFGEITVTGAGSTLSTGAALTVGNFGQGRMTVSNGGTVTASQLKIADDFRGDVFIDAATLTDTVGTTVGNRAAGALTLSNGAVLQSPLVTVVPLGTLSGSGTVDGELLNEGVVRPGNDAGILNIDGGFSQVLGTLEVELGGPAAGTEYDQLIVSGAATIGGTLRVALIDGYNPSSGEFVIVQAASVVGAFTVEDVPAGFTVTYESGRVVLAIGDGCSADFNGDGTVNTQDVLVFLNAWVAQQPSADMNGDGSVNTLDFILFLNLWTAGC